jgi:hypothetical protein
MIFIKWIPGALIVSIIAMKILAYEELTTYYDCLNASTILGFPINISGISIAS